MINAHALIIASTAVIPNCVVLTENIKKFA
jgi:predicted nucleic acid-binding protein